MRKVEPLAYGEAQLYNFVYVQGNSVFGILYTAKELNFFSKVNWYERYI